MHMQEKWLSSFKPSNVKLLATVYFGSVKLRSKHSSVTPVSKGISTAKTGAKTYVIDFPREKILFDDLDPSQFDLEREMGGSPYGIVRVDYKHQDQSAVSASITLGWARIKMYVHKSDVGSSNVSLSYGRSQWMLAAGDDYHTLHPGTASEKAIQGPGGALSPEPQQQGEHLNMAVLDDVCQCNWLITNKLYYTLQRSSLCLQYLSS